MRPSTILAGLFAVLVVVTPQASQPQVPNLEDLLSGQSDAPSIGLSDLLGGGAGKSGQLLEELLGGEGGMPPGLNDFFGASPDEGVTPKGTSEEIAFAKTCSQSMGNPMLDPFLADLADTPLDSSADLVSNFRSMLGLMKRLAGIDPCLLRDVLIMEALVGSFNGDFTRARETLDTLLPPPSETESGLEVIAQLARASILSLQQRHDEAEAIMAAMAPRVDALFRPDSRLALALEAARVDIAFGMADAARAEHNETHARALYEDSLARYERFAGRASRALPPNDELICLSRVTSARVHLRLGQRARSEALLREALNPSSDCGRLLGPDNIWTAPALHDLGMILMDRGDLAEAEVELSKALDLVRQQRGEKHPHTVAVRRSVAELRILQGRTDAALDHLGAMSDGMLTWLGGELRMTGSQAQRRRVAALQSDHQDLALLIALAAPDNLMAQRLAADAVLRYKGMQGEEDAVLERLARRSDDPASAELAAEIARLRSDLAASYSAGTSRLASASSRTIDTLTDQLADAEARTRAQERSLRSPARGAESGRRCRNG